MKKETRGRKPIHDWNSVDWSMSNTIIADILGTNDQYVCRVRMRLAPETKYKTNLKTFAMRDRWAHVDWTKTDWQISKEEGVEHGNVWKTRKNMEKAGFIKPRTSGE